MGDRGESAQSTFKVVVDLFARKTREPRAWARRVAKLGMDTSWRRIGVGAGVSFCSEYVRGRVVKKFAGAGR